MKKKKAENLTIALIVGMVGIAAVWDYIGYILFFAVVIGLIVLFIKNKQGTGLSNVSAKNYQNLPRLEHPAGYVYIIQDVEVSKAYKIGRTNHPKRRLNRFGVELPFKTEVIHILRTDNAVEAEKRLHEKYARRHKRGEWFDLSEEQLEEIRQMGMSS